MKLLHALVLFLFPSNTAPKEQEFTYKYQMYPFDEGTYFKIKAPNRTEADELARIEHARIVETGGTVMRELFFVPR